MNTGANAKVVKSMFTVSRPSSLFKSRVFDAGTQESLLPKHISLHLDQVRNGSICFDTNYADEIADALQDWASQNGATHFMHWFQPLRNGHAEKQDSFLEWHQGFEGCEKLTGKRLLLGESDASSLPSGGLRITHQARGYTCWDPASFPFLWETEAGLSLCIPALFYSWTGVALDQKIPLLRSNQKMSTAVKRLLHLCKSSGDFVFPTLSSEQEYFLIERNLFGLRPDLVLCGRTLFGALPAKGQELGDHYLSAVSDKALGFMSEFEEAALLLGIPVKTRHNEVAPAQHSISVLFEPISSGADHNLLLMEVMKRTATKMGLACLFHEMPFAGLNGSGKNNQWSLSTDEGVNLLEPKGESLLFLTLLTSILRAVHEHAGLLRASIGSAGNDHRLGAVESPPSIVSVSLGDSLEQLVMDIVYGKPKSAVTAHRIELDLRHISPHDAGLSDRNGTSFFAFTGNKFELRGVGASQNCTFPMAILNAIVADSLQLILDEIDDVVKDRKDLSESALLELSLPVLRKHLIAAVPILFGGNNDSDDWSDLARTRGLPNIARSFHAFGELQTKKSIRVLEDVFSAQELTSRFNILVEEYAKTLNVEANVMVEMFQTQIRPAVQKDLERQLALLDVAQSYSLKMSHRAVQRICELIEMATDICEEVKKLQDQSSEMGWEAKGRVFCELIAPKMDELRQQVDALELLVDDELWPIPKYREILYSV
jgi:glutamine synthetase